MPSEKFKRSTSFRHAAKSFFGNFSAVSPYSFGLSLSPNTFTLLEDNDAASQADRRSAHNALERQRRENLNVKFQELAHALPSLQTVRRPSKTMIVAKSLEFVANSLSRESNYQNEITDLRKQNERLRKQASTLSSGQPKRRSPLSTPPQTNASSPSSLPSPPITQKPLQQQPVTTTATTAATTQHVLAPQYAQEQGKKPTRQQLEKDILFYQNQQQKQQEHEQQQQQYQVEDPLISAAADYQSWIAATTMPERDYCLYDSDPALMAPSFMYQRDPLLTTVPPPYYYEQAMSMNPAMIFTSTAPAHAPPVAPASMEAYHHSIVSGGPAGNILV
ncbi:hypothetical protein BDB00DRAFT_794486 [Zychaea mexicana]|uniref:uncharacterized protein n=1 Tax=Zychaea mexicana TaxID=64656 RepID=UPI0022FEDF02|nr:uncharacterized protein BDB00DRAFT_794486 [Zychaea mexicana]KAI9499563.1 hypothetical protein BDB00DRAFT_794486 [Zychaea mexicana]